MLSDTAQRLIHPERLTERGALIVCIGWAVSQSGLMAGGASRPKVSGTQRTAKGSEEIGLEGL